MQYILEFMREDFKDFGGKIIGGVLLFLAVKYFPILKKLFRCNSQTSKCRSAYRRKRTI